MLPKVSVIVPVYNKEKYLRNCLDILLNQSLQDIEIICVDDCSSDASREILNEYARKDSRIICIFHEINKSTSQTRKDGVSVSTGKYIMFVDADDELYLHSCEKAYAAIEKYQTDMVHFNTSIENCAKVSQARINMNKKLVQPYLGRLQTEDLIISCWQEEKFGFQIWNKIYNGAIVRKAFSEIEDGSFPKAQDLYAFFVIAFYSKTYFGIKDELYKYNFGLGVTGRDFIELDNFKTLLTEKEICDVILRFLDKHGQREKYSEIVNDLYNSFLNECVVRWRDNLATTSKSEGFTYLAETFGLEDVICVLAKKDWNPEDRIGKIMADNTFFNHKKRDKKKRKTIAAYYRCIANGGAQRVVAMLCNRWAEMKDNKGNNLYNVVLVTDVEKEENEYTLSEKVQRAYVPAYAMSAKERFRERYRAWAQIVKDYDIDIVVSSLWSNPVTYWDMLSIKGQPTKPAFIIHTQSFCAVPFDFTTNTAIGQIYKYMVCDGVITLSECDKLFVESFNNHVAHIVNQIAFNPDSTPLSSYEKNTIVWVGRISYEKQPLDAIKMMKFVVDKIPDAKLIVVGDGNETIKRQMGELVQQYDLEHNVEMTGFTLDVSCYYELASVMVCTSKYEGFSLTMGEAMSYGVPVISYDMPWLTFIQDGRGIITVPQNEYVLLAQRVVDILSKQEEIRDIGIRGKQQITEIAEHDIENDWKEFFDDISEVQEHLKEKQDSAGIIFKYLTLYQFEGRKKIINRNIQDKKRLEKELQKAKKELQKVKNGLSYKIGRAITWLPRKLTGKK